MNRRGFLGAILAAPAVPLIPAAEPVIEPITSNFSQLLSEGLKSHWDEHYETSGDIEWRIAAFEDEMSDAEDDKYQALIVGVTDRRAVLDIAMDCV